MSKVSDTLITHQSNRRVYDVPPLSTALVTDKTIQMDSMEAWEYVIEFKCKFGGFVSDPKDIPILKENARAAIINDIFGEFIPLIIKVKHGIYNRDFKEALAAIDELSGRMFQS